ncbi:H-NS family nucleoid-associated regulatory protein [Stenotrophomonas sp. NPDC078853]|uniref:H-NS histone family protein n=1 Tax=Stenotrophomonas sp. NPDC078853 TaxID=3364534 RepID=UPI00384D5E43
MKFALERFSLAELTQLIKTAEQRLKVVRTRRPIAEVRRDLTRFAALQGYGIEDLLGATPETASPTRRAARKSPKVAAKYRDPENRRNTWSGRGSQPRWLAAKVKRGHQAADFLIPGLAKPTAKKQTVVGKRTVYKAGAA